MSRKGSPNPLTPEHARRRSLQWFPKPFVHVSVPHPDSWQGSPWKTQNQAPRPYGANEAELVGVHGRGDAALALDLFLARNDLAGPNEHLGHPDQYCPLDPVVLLLG